jgi:hypothetical protein
MPFMPAVSLNQWSGALSAWICAACGFCCDWFTPFLVSLFCSVQSFGFHNVCCPNASWLMVLGLSFYPLEQAPNMVIYAMSKLGTATSGLI